MFLETDVYERAIAFLKECDAAKAPHANGRSLLAHLEETARIAEAWQQPSELSRAALFHSIYGTEVYRRETVHAESRRSDVRALIGPDSERLVYLFGSISRAHFWERVIKVGSRRTVQIQRHRGAGTEMIDPAERFALIILLLANDAEQMCAADGAPGLWLANMAAKSKNLDDHYGRVPAIAEAIGRITPRAEELLLRDYRRGVDMISKDSLAAASTFHELTAGHPYLAEPHAWLAYVALESGQLDVTLEHAALAKQRLQQFGTSWDKRLSNQEWYRFAHTLEQHAKAVHEAATLPFSLEGDSSNVFSLLQTQINRDRAEGQSTVLSGRRFQRFIDHYVEAENLAETTYPDLPARPWHEPVTFPIVAELERSYPAIAAELSRIHPDAFHADAEAISRQGSWDVLMLYERGKRHDDNCNLVPVTTRIVEAFETVRTYAGLISFSRMEPHTHIEPHRGPTNVRIRCHLPIAVPKGDCGIRVAGEARRWEPGRCLVFDDFFTHEAWNLTNEPRVVLIVDLWNPELTDEEVRRLKRLQNRVFWQSRNLERYWENNRKAAQARSGTWAQRMPSYRKVSEQ